MPTEPQPVTLAAVVTLAVEVCDPEGASDPLTSLLERYEDEDLPITDWSESAPTRSAPLSAAPVEQPQL